MRPHHFAVIFFEATALTLINFDGSTFPLCQVTKFQQNHFFHSCSLTNNGFQGRKLKTTVLAQSPIFLSRLNMGGKLIGNE